MRSKFPWFWIVQFVALASLSLTNFFYPYGVLEFYRGHRAPQKVERPSEELYSWVLGLEELPPPNKTIRDFFSNHNEVTYDEENIWTPEDPSLNQYTHELYGPEGRSSETINDAWEEFENWILSGQPAAPPEHAAAIKKWIHATDEIPEPSPDLCRWISSMTSPQSPPKELRMLILNSRQKRPGSWQLASDQVRIAAPCIMAAALFTLLGLLTPSIRRPLARVFVLVFLFWTVGRLRSSLGPPEWNLTHATVIGGLCLGTAMVISSLKAVPRMTAGWTLFLIITVWWVSISAVSFSTRLQPEHTLARMNVTTACSLVALAGIINAFYWLIGKSEDPPQDDAGIVQRRPPQLWTLWIVQFVILLTNGLIALVFPSWLADLFTRARFDYLTVDVVNDAVEMLGVWIIAMALFSYFALGVARNWVWQGISIIFCVVFLLLAISTLIYAQSGEYALWAYLYGFQGVVFIPLTIILLLQKDPWESENVERAASDDWSLVDLMIGPPLLWSPLLFKRRKLFRNGVAARGYLRVLPSNSDESSGVAPRPENEFFVPGEKLPIQMRFSNRCQDDDASLDIRGCGLSVSNASNCRLDLLFATGEFAPFSTLSEFRHLMCSGNLKKLIDHNLVLREGLAAGMRRAPSSFAQLSYYHQFVIEWLTPSAEHYLVRFRIVPSSDTTGAETFDPVNSRGYPDEEDLKHLWLHDRRGDETRSKDYLRTELRERLENGQTFSFRLEMQFHKPELGDSLVWFDPSREWNVRECPWVPLAELVLNEPLNEAESDALAFDPSYLPYSLNMPSPENTAAIDDPRAIAASRHRIAGFLGRLRLRRRKPPNVHVDLKEIASDMFEADERPLETQR